MRSLISFDIECAPNGIGLIIGGRIKGHMKTRFVPKMNALSLSSFTNTILDIGIVSSATTLGIVGVKVGTIQ
jgi:ribosomal protein S3